ncbi:MAG: tetratricopeptide repeat protein [Bacteroidota bacterium]
MFQQREAVERPVIFNGNRRFLKWLFLMLFILIALTGNNSKISCDTISNDPMTEIIELYYRGRFTESLTRLGQIVAKNPDNDLARLNLARLLKENGKQTEALTHLKYLVKKDPTAERYRSVLVETAYLAGKPELAVEYYYPDESDSLILYWSGLALADLGKTDLARGALLESIKQRPYNPMAYYALGLLEQKLSHTKEAFTRFQQALSQEPNLNKSYFPLAKNYIGTKQHKTSYNLLVKAGSTEPWRFPVNHDFQAPLEISEDISEETAANETKTQETDPSLVIKVPENRESIPEIRIGLASKIQRLRIKTRGQYRLTSQGGLLRIGAADEVLLFVRTKKGIEVYDGKGKYLFKSWQPFSLGYEEPGATSLIYDARFGNGSYWSKGKRRIYRGVIEILPKSSGLTIVNRVNIEEYLYGVVPSEIPASWPQAALEAQAIAARTYALANLGRYRIQGFDLLATPTSQVYNGVTQEADSVIEAVNATRGKILTFEGKPAGTFYYDNSGGYTESGAFVWGDDRPYLQAIPEKPLTTRDQYLAPDDLAAWLTEQPDCVSFREGYYVRSAYRWTHWIPREQIESRIRSKARIGRIKAIIPMERGISGRVKRVMVKGTAGSYIISGESIPYRLGGLRSTLFVVQPKIGKDGLPESFIFNGGGWGHGVGMSQSGAVGMALDGASAAEILAYYYPGTELISKY